MNSSIGLSVTEKARFLMARPVPYTAQFSASTTSASSITITTADDFDSPEVEVWVLHDTVWKTFVRNERTVWHQKGSIDINVA